METTKSIDKMAEMDKLTELMQCVADVNKGRVRELLFSLLFEEYDKGWNRGYDAGMKIANN